ncbi:MAG: carboxymuconolactone decarboxylase family protein [Candidatus Dormibacter sp.]|uniref:carboxymuconolactone decarboxylase family protein n=1 Tax=Candidatus Dormibacter sp. TaxID=2973982 RepID=UPI000DAF786A|nr:MAG: hypothetical protein DLM66_09015 [Candidatus Dormibacteraeota bacterium]
MRRPEALHEDRHHQAAQNGPRRRVAGGCRRQFADRARLVDRSLPNGQGICSKKPYPSSKLVPAGSDSEVARLPYVLSGRSPAADRAYQEIAKLGRPIANLYRLLANQPPALEAFMGMSRYVRGGSSLEPQLRELVILATAYTFGQRYEIAHHLEAARALGVPEAKLSAVAPGGDLQALTGPERTAVQFSRETARTRTCSDESPGPRSPWTPIWEIGSRDRRCSWIPQTSQQGTLTAAATRRAARPKSSSACSGARTSTLSPGSWA